MWVVKLWIYQALIRFNFRYFCNRYAGCFWNVGFPLFAFRFAFLTLEDCSAFGCSLFACLFLTFATLRLRNTFFANCRWSRFSRNCLLFKELRIGIYIFGSARFLDCFASIFTNCLFSFKFEALRRQFRILYISYSACLVISVDFTLPSNMGFWFY